MRHHTEFQNIVPTPTVPRISGEHTVPQGSVERDFHISSPIALKFFVPTEPMIAYGQLTDVFYRAWFISPIFDLKPKLGKKSMPAMPNIMPISDAMSTLYCISVANLAAQIAQIDVHMIEWVGVRDSQRLVALGPSSTPQDITPQFWDGAGTWASAFPAPYNVTTVYFSPPVGPRYWQVALVFDVIKDEILGIDPTMPEGATALSLETFFGTGA